MTHEKYCPLSIPRAPQLPISVICICEQIRAAITEAVAQERERREQMLKMRETADKHFQDCRNCQGDHYPCGKMAKLDNAWKTAAAAIQEGKRE